MELLLVKHINYDGNQASVPDMSAHSWESIMRASNTSKSVLFTWMTLLTVPVLVVNTACEGWNTVERLNKEGMVLYHSDRGFVLTPVGSRVHCPSTQNLYWCSPSGKSTTAAKLFWLGQKNNAIQRLLSRKHYSISIRINYSHFAKLKCFFQVFPKPAHLLLRGILVAQLLNDPDTKISLPAPVQRNTVGLAWLGHLLSLSRSRCQARNSWISWGAWHNWTHINIITTHGGPQKKKLGLACPTGNLVNTSM